MIEAFILSIAIDCGGWSGICGSYRYVEYPNKAECITAAEDFLRINKRISEKQNVIICAPKGKLFHNAEQVKK